MVITESTMYWITRLDYIHDFLLIFGGVGFVISLIVTTILVLIGEDSCIKYAEAKTYYKRAKQFVLLSIFFLLLIVGGLFTPTTKECAAIKLVPIIVNDESVQQLPEKVVELANDWIDELKPEKVLEGKAD